MTRVRRLAIVRYKLAARTYRRRQSSYEAMAAARAVMLTACGYETAYSYMGEFCNLHERDFPSYIHAKSHPETYDRAAVAEGRLYRYSGFHRPVDRATHETTATASRRRALELQRTLELDPVDRFVAGWSVWYIGFDGKGYMAKWTRSDFAGVPVLRIYECGEFFAVTLRKAPIMDETGARNFFAGLPDPKFQTLPVPELIFDPATQSVEA